jgi:nitrite reductase/ring-hydroxylating ferredoxin subunit/DMSO/TMAO reductase YedYZ heme-binding membrane subunit
MGHRYAAVQWNANKIAYDLWIVACLAAFLAAFLAVGLAARPDGHAADPVGLLIRALGAAAFLMLSATLAIGPLARLSRRFNPFLYNRRHLGVATFLVAAAHFGLATAWYHGSGPLNPFVSLLASSPLAASIDGVPFELFGLAAFAVLLAMAATSHDFWLNNLTAPLWKALHMLVYAAYALIVLHVAFGALQTARGAAYPALTVAAALAIGALHLAAAFRERRRDRLMAGRKPVAGWIEICAPADIPDKRAVIAPLPGGERVAIFRDGARIYAVTNVCRHQNGPLGEGCIVDGAITCPWHGWQYRPEDGVSPPPYTEKIATYDLRLEAGRILLRRNANRPGTKSAFLMLERAP